LVPVTNNIEDLVGKQVDHLTVGFDGVGEKWFSGIVVCIHPTNTNELVIRYDCELDKMYSFSYDEFSKGCVVLIPLSPEKVVGKKIQQRFCNEVEDDFWWETGLVIAHDREEYTVNFFEPETCEDDEIDDFCDVYEVCSFPLIDDYLNHDIRFL